jgi:hypothetical protein
MAAVTGSLPSGESESGVVRCVLFPLPISALDVAGIIGSATRDAMPSGGVLGLATNLEGSRVVLTVSDTGKGMSEAVRGTAGPNTLSRSISSSDDASGQRASRTPRRWLAA